MIHTHRLTIFIFTLLCSLTAVRGQELRDSVLIHFHQSKTNLDTAYMHNSETLRLAIPDSGFVLRKVEVTGAASPEGSVKFNEWLSDQRAKRIFDYVNRQTLLPDSLTSFTFVGRDWAGLRRMVMADSAVPYQSEVISLLDEIIALDNGEERESYGNLQKIKNLRGGEPYRYMYRNIFPYLRASRLVLTYRPRIHSMYVGPTMSYLPVPMEISEPAIDSVKVPNLKPFYMGLKTNMLFDALAVPNIGAEFYLGKNYSIVGNWMYGWWDTDRTHHYWRIYGGDIAVRKWFGRKAQQKPLQGQHIGVYGGVVTYDFELGGTGYMGGLPGRPLWARTNWYCGVEYGYSLPVAKRLNIDFTLGLGYLGGTYIVYEPEDKCYVWKETRMRHWWGPTKAEISLVWLIGRGNVNKKGVNR